MSAVNKPLVLDSWAVIALLEGKPAGEQVASLILSAQTQNVPIFISIINAGELWYILAREVSESEANQSIESLINMGIAIENINWEITLKAAWFKTTHRLSYADCFAAALAYSKDALLVTGDPEFKQLESQINLYFLL